MSVLASAHGLAASSGVVAAWLITALILLLLAAVFWSFLRRSGTLHTLEVDKLDQRPPQEQIDDAAPADDAAAAVEGAASDAAPSDGPDAGPRPDAAQG